MCGLMMQLLNIMAESFCWGEFGELQAVLDVFFVVVQVLH